MKNSLMTSTIYSVSYRIKKYIPSPTQKKRKQRKNKNTKKTRNIFLLVNNLELYTFLSLLSNLLYFLILLIHVMTSYYHFLFSTFIFSKTVYAKMLVSHLCMRFCTHIKFYLFRMMNFEMEISQNCILEISCGPTAKFSSSYLRRLKEFF